MRMGSSGAGHKQNTSERNVLPSHDDQKCDSADFNGSKNFKKLRISTLFSVTNYSLVG